MKNRLEGSRTRANRHWKDIVRGFELTSTVLADGAVLRFRTPDPSLRRQLSDRAGMAPADRNQAYLNACQKAPYASADTKRKWRRVLGL